MFDDLKEYLREWFKKVITSRLFVLAVVFCLMSSALVMRLFNLQIIKGEEYQDAYTAMTEKVIKTASTRGNIYDRNGNVLAYNELAYDVTIQDTGAYKTDAQWNTMLYDLVSILNKHGESAQTSLELTLDHDGNVVYTSETQSGRKRFLRDYYGLKNVAEIYHIAARELGVDLADCVSVADNIKRDIPGAKAAGIGCNIIFRSPEKKHPVEFTEETRPDAVIDTFPELLELLPPLK